MGASDTPQKAATSPLRHGVSAGDGEPLRPVPSAGDDISLARPVARWTAWPLLASITAVAVGLRIWRLGFGLPEFYIHDEVLEVQRAFAILRGDFTYLPGPKGFLLFALAGGYAVHGAVLLLLGRVSSFAEYTSLASVEPGHFIFLGRLTSVAFAALSVLLLYRLGTRMFGDRLWGLALAFLWATAAQSVWLSHYLLIEPLLALLGIALLLPTLSILQKVRWSSLIAAALLAAAATACKLYAGILFLLPLLAYLLSGPEASWARALTRLRESRLWGMIGLFVLAWLIFAPGMVAHALDLLGLELKTRAFLPPSDIPKETHLGYYLTHTRWHVGTLILPFCAAGAVAAAIRREKLVLLCAIVATGFVFALGAVRTNAMVFPRYIHLSLPFFTIVSLYGARAFADAASRVVPRARTGWPAHATLAAFTAIAFYNSAESLARTAHFQPRYELIESRALDWFERHVPPGSKVFVKGNAIWPGHQTLPIWDLPENYLERYELALARHEPESNLEILRDLAAAPKEPRYDLVAVTRWMPVKSLEEYLKDGVEYFIIEESDYSDVEPERYSRDARSTRIELFGALKRSPQVALLARFSGPNRSRLPVAIEVFGPANRGRAGEH